MVSPSNDSISQAIEKYKPIVNEIGLGGVLGYCSGKQASAIHK